MCFSLSFKRLQTCKYICFSLQVTSSRLHELEMERLQIQEERELMARQQDAMKETAGPRELRTYPSIPLRNVGFCVTLIGNQSSIFNPSFKC